MSNWSNQAKKYLQYERNEEHKAYVQRLVSENKEDELKLLLGTRLTFGTAGIRGRMGPGFTQMNDLVIIQTSQGLASYLIECNGEKVCRERGVIIGHDARHNSDRFARLAALAFVQKGIPVHYCELIVPTPLVAFGVSLFNCICGVVITASHNPKQDNGYKVYWSNGAQILSPHDSNIQRQIERPENQEPWPMSWRHECLTTKTSKTLANYFSASSLDSLDSQPTKKSSHLPKEFEGLFREIYGELTKNYFAYIRRLVGEHYLQNRSFAQSITYTTMHGVGHMYLTRALEIAGFKQLHAVEAQREPDPEFPTVKFPNPEEAGALNLAFETAIRTGSGLILANDPDADRCAAALYDIKSRGKRVLTGNEIGALLGWWIWRCYRARSDASSLAGQETLEDEDDSTVPLGRSPKSPKSPVVSAMPSYQAPTKKPQDCYMLSTAVSSRFLKSMSQVEGFNFIETLTGFKHMGNVAHELITKQDKCVLFAYEEAIGYMVDPKILDKDGISAAVQLAQCAAYVKYAYKRTLDAQLSWLYVLYGYHFSLNSYYLCYDHDTIQAVFHRLQTDYPQNFGPSEAPDEFVVTRIRDLNNGFDNGEPSNRASLPTSSSSFMVTFFIGSEIQFTIRTSGTEPKIKYYSEIVASLPQEDPDDDALREAQESAKLAAQARLRRFVDAAVERCLRPAYYNLEAATGSD